MLNLQEVAPGLELTPSGWWGGQGASEVSYPAEGNALCFLVEESSFWFEHRNRCILEALKLFPPAGTLFDVGGGNGCVARAIQNAGMDVVLVEPGLDGVRNASHRGIRQIVRGTLEDAGVLRESIPAVGLFDVVEHVSDDSGFLAGIHRALTPGGRIYITVPAFQCMWSGEDEIAGHARRYTLAGLRRLLESTGYTIEFASGFFSFLMLPILLRRVLPYRLGFKTQLSETGARADHEIRNPLARRIVQALTGRESAKIAAQRPLRLGASYLVVAQKASARDKAPHTR